MANTYTTIQGDMWDSISHKLYGTEQALNVLLDANPQYTAYVVFPAGITLNVPEYTAPTPTELPPWRR